MLKLDFHPAGRHFLPRLHLQNRIPLIQQMLPKNRAQLLPIPRFKRLQHLIMIMNRAIPLRDLKIRPKPQRLQAPIHSNISLPQC